MIIEVYKNIFIRHEIKNNKNIIELRHMNTLSLPLCRLAMLLNDPLMYELKYKMNEYGECTYK